MRVINVVDLMVLGEAGNHPHALGSEGFNGLFGTSTPVVINYHGYPAQVKALLFERNHHMEHKRIEILGYVRFDLTEFLFKEGEWH